MAISMQIIEQYTGIPERTLYTWVKRGILPNSDDVFDYIKAIIKHLKDQNKEILEKKTGKQSELEIEKTRLTRAQADKLELENLERSGELTDASQVEKVWMASVLACKSRLLAIPSGVSDELTKIDDPIKIANILESRIYEALDELSKGVKDENNKN